MRSLAYNRYRGNSGHVEYVPESPGEHSHPTQSQQPRERRPPGQPPEKNRPPAPFAGLGEGLSGLLRRFRFPELETEDLILLLILYLMYRESGDEELLMIMGGMYLL